MHIDIDAAYLVMYNAKSCIVGHYFSSSLPLSPPVKLTPTPNSPIHTECITLTLTLRYVVISAGKAETGGLSAKQEPYT